MTADRRDYFGKMIDLEVDGNTKNSEWIQRFAWVFAYLEMPDKVGRDDKIKMLGFTV